MLARIRRALKDAILLRAASYPDTDLIFTDAETALRLRHPKIIASDLWPDVIP